MSALSRRAEYLLQAVQHNIELERFFHPVGEFRFHCVVRQSVQFADVLAEGCQRDNGNICGIGVIADFSVDLETGLSGQSARVVVPPINLPSPMSRSNLRMIFPLRVLGWNIASTIF